MGFAKIIEREKHAPDRIEEYTSFITMASKRMYGIVKNLLDVHTIEQGKLVNKPENVDLDHTILALIENHRLHAGKKNISIKLENRSPGTTILIDPFVINQVMDNLISNAIKFSPAGKEVTVELQAHAGRIRLQVADQGPGLTAEDRKKLFGKFARLSAAPTGDENSTGLGLSIVKKLVDGAHGTIECVSEPGRGALFVVEIPV